MTLDKRRALTRAWNLAKQTGKPHYVWYAKGTTTPVVRDRLPSYGEWPTTEVLRVSQHATYESVPRPYGAIRRREYAVGERDPTPGVRG